MVAMVLMAYYKDKEFKFYLADQLFSFITIKGKMKHESTFFMSEKEYEKKIYHICLIPLSEWMLIKTDSLKVQDWDLLLPRT